MAKETFVLSIKGTVERNEVTEEISYPAYEARFEGEVDAVGGGIAILMHKQPDFKKIVEVCAQHSGSVMPNRLFFACESKAGENGKKRSKSELTGSRENLIDYIVHKMKTAPEICEVMTQAVTKYYASINP